MKKQALVKLTNRHRAVILAEVSATRGSTPREQGAFMVIAPDGSFIGTIGGGTLEWQAQAQAQAMLARDEASRLIRQSLGPDLGQCCGGAVELRLTRFDHEQAQALADDKDESREILIFGAGHVGRALIMALAPLPFHLRWIDSRAEQFPHLLPAHVKAITTNPVAQMAETPPGAFALILTHSHALDLELTAQALKNQALAFIGLIGSATKKARFFSKLTKMGFSEADLARITSPIGISGLSSKLPAAIAASVAVDLLMRDERLKNQQKPLTARAGSA